MLLCLKTKLAQLYLSRWGLYDETDADAFDIADSSDDEEMTELLVLAHTEPRETCFSRERLQSDEHVQKLKREMSFENYYRMPEASLLMLLSFFTTTQLSVDEGMSRLKTKLEPISPVIVLHCTIRYLAGRNYQDIHLVRV